MRNLMSSLPATSALFFRRRGCSIVSTLLSTVVPQTFVAVVDLSLISAVNDIWAWTLALLTRSIRIRLRIHRRCNAQNCEHQRDFSHDNLLYFSPKRENAHGE